MEDWKEILKTISVAKKILDKFIEIIAVTEMSHEDTDIKSFIVKYPSARRGIAYAIINANELIQSNPKISSHWKERSKNLQNEWAVVNLAWEMLASNKIGYTELNKKFNLQTHATNVHTQLAEFEEKFPAIFA
jgi:hypothetical protein